MEPKTPEPKVREWDGELVEFPGTMSEEEIQEAIAGSMGASVAADPTPTNPDTSTITGKPTALTPGGMTAGSKIAVAGMRNIPTAASMLMNPATAPLKIAGLLFGSELLAGEMEEMLSNPEYQSGMEGIKRQGEILMDSSINAGAGYYGDRFLMPWLAKHANKLKNFTTRPIVKQTLGRFIKPKGGYGQEVQTAQDTLGRFYRQGEDPFSLTLDQLHSGQKTLLEGAGNLSRSSFGGGRVMRKMDMRNQAEVNEFVTSFLASTTQTNPRQFGHMMKSLLRKDHAYLTAKTNHLYGEFREMAYGKGIDVNFGDAFRYLKDNSDNRFARGVFAKVFRSDPKIAGAIKGGEELLLRTPDELEAIFQAMPAAQMQEIIDQMSHNLPVETAVDLYHNVNRMFGKSKEGGMKRFSSEFKKHLDSALEESLGETDDFIVAAAIKDKAGNVYTAPSHHLALDKLDEAGGVYDKQSANLFYTSKGRTIGRDEAVSITGEISKDAQDIIGHKVSGAYEKFKEANAFAAKHGERIEKKIIDTMFKKIGAEKPSGIIGMFSGKGGGDTLTAVKKHFASSDVLNMDDFENSVRQPLRHWILSQAVDPETGAVSGAKLANIFDKMQTNQGPAFMREVFGPNAPEAFRDAATTLNLIAKTKESSILMKMVQATALMGGTSAALYGAGQPIERIIGGGVAVMFTPYALSKIMANPKLTRIITDGFVAGPGTSKFARAVLVVGIQNRKALAKLKDMNPEAQEFYDKMYEEEMPERQMNPPLFPGLN